MAIAMCIYALAFIAMTTTLLLFGYLKFQQAAEEAERLDNRGSSLQEYREAEYRKAA